MYFFFRQDIYFRSLETESVLIPGKDWSSRSRSSYRSFIRLELLTLAFMLAALLELVRWLFCDWWDSKKIHCFYTVWRPRRTLEEEVVGSCGPHWNGEKKLGVGDIGRGLRKPIQGKASFPLLFFAKDNFVSPPHHGLISYVNNFLQFNTNRVSLVG